MAKEEKWKGVISNMVWNWSRSKDILAWENELFCNIRERIINSYTKTEVTRHLNTWNSDLVTGMALVAPISYDLSISE